MNCCYQSPQTSTISEDFTHLPSFNSTTPTKTSEISEGFTDGHFAVFNTTTDTNTSHAITFNTEEVLVIKKTSSLEKIEVGLARARASIQRAVVTRNYTSYKKESYIPRGPIYRNAYAFHQEGEPPLVHVGPCNNIYSAEGQFIEEMESGRTLFSARHPDEAHAFFLPVSIVNVVRFINKPANTFSRDPLRHLVTDYITSTPTGTEAKGVTIS
ncbi:hypothetical protein MRB53_009215 [Persea americana]|uniref:Uncharacterized protein n=1 Tax=Persea americana TaxID=3435 RepID=A0ACC2LP52_PERAE|nr:hypothetical protein MRB53_009215 [Persea americana]